MVEIKHKIFIIFLLLFSIFAVISAYFIEHILGHEPCNLCLIERLPYILTIIIISIFLFYKKFEGFFLAILGLIFFIATLISLYHLGIEQGFIKESLVCDLGLKNNPLTKEALLNQLNKRIISCKDVTFRIFGLSLATFNIIFSLIFSSISIKNFINYEKNI